MIEGDEAVLVEGSFWVRLFVVVEVGGVEQVGGVWPKAAISGVQDEL